VISYVSYLEALLGGEYDEESQCLRYADARAFNRAMNHLFPDHWTRSGRRPMVRTLAVTMYNGDVHVVRLQPFPSRHCIAVQELKVPEKEATGGGEKEQLVGA